MAMVDSVGIMHPAYFVGRAEILDWLNSTLQLRLTKIEETASGAVACQVFDLLFPNTVQMSRVNWGARSEWEFINNYKILQAACDKIGVDRKIEVDRLIKAKAQDNLEFMQWLKKFYDDNIGTGNAAQNYDAQGRRALGKGASMMKWAKTASGTTGASAISPEKPNLARPVRTTTSPSSSTKPASTTHSVVAAAAAKAPVTTASSKPSQQLSTDKENPEHAAVVSALRLEIDTNRRNLQRVQEETSERIARLEHLLKTCESERDYYFGKLKSVEVALQEMQGTTDDGAVVLNTISNILYDEAAGAPAGNNSAANTTGTSLLGEE